MYITGGFVGLSMWMSDFTHHSCCLGMAAACLQDTHVQNITVGQHHSQVMCDLVMWGTGRRFLACLEHMNLYKLPLERNWRGKKMFFPSFLDMYKCGRRTGHQRGHAGDEAPALRHCLKPGGMLPPSLSQGNVAYFSETLFFLLIGPFGAGSMEKLGKSGNRQTQTLGFSISHFECSPSSPMEITGETSHWSEAGSQSVNADILRGRRKCRT